MARKLEVEIVGDASSLHRALGQADKGASKFGSTVGKLGKAAALGAGAAGVGALIYTLKTGIGEFNDSQKVAAQTAAVLKSMGKTAGVTAKDVDELATSLMNKSGIDDEAIKSGENLLLTFRNIQNQAGKNNDIFNQATQIMTDFSVRFGKDIPQSAVLVGKALNDPIKGLTALARVGVQFTDGQKKLIKHLVDTGHTMQAQKIIMAELSAETKGAAAAMGQTLGGQINIIRENFNNWAGDMVAKMIPALTNLGNWVRANWPQISATIRNAWEADIKPPLVAMIALVKQVVATIRSNWNTIGPIVKAVASIIRAEVQVITGALRLVTALLRGDWGAAWNAAKAIVGGFVAYVRGELNLLKGIVTAALRGAVAAISALGGAFLSAGRSLGHALVRGVLSALSGLGSAIRDAIASAISYAVSHIPRPNIHIPTPHVNIPGIPGFASGVKGFSGGMALVGERGPELVNLPRGSDVMPLRAGAGGGASIVFNFPNYIGSKSDLQQAMREAARSFSDLNGRAVMG